MKPFAHILFCAGVACAALVPTASVADTTDASIVSSAPQAPLDRYFGKLEMSPLGIVNAIRHVSERADAGAVDSEHAIDGLGVVEDSVRDWETQFPGDTWLPRIVASIERVYRKFPDAQSQANEIRTAYWLTSKYPESVEARFFLAQNGMNDGVTEAAYASHVDPMPAVLKP